MKNLYLEHLRSVIIGNRYCFCPFDFVQLTWVADPAYSVVFLWKSVHVDEHQEFHETFMFSYSTQSKVCCWCASRWVSPFMTSATSVFLLGVQNLCCKAFESIFTKDLVFDLDVKHVFHGIEFVQILNLQVDKVVWTNQTIPCFLLSSLTWIQYWIASLYSG